MNVEQGNLTNFNASFYTGPVNGADNHTHQLGNFRVNDNGPSSSAQTRVFPFQGF
jgi:hypothetical protein